MTAGSRPDASPNLYQHAVVGNVQAVFEVRLEQGCRNAVLKLVALDPRPVQQTVSVQRVGADLDVLELEIDADLPAVFTQGVLHLIETFGTAEFRDQVAAVICAVACRIRVQPIGPPVDGDADLVLHLGDRQLQPRLPEIAPRADNVGHDIDGDALHGRILS